MRKKMFQGLIIGCVCLVSTACLLWADKGEISPEAVEVSNTIMLGIYQEILAVKESYPDLQDFGEANLSKNPHGIYTIRYDFISPKGGDPYCFGIAISAMGDVEFEGESGRFDYGFPKLNLKISGFHRRNPLRTQFDVLPLIPKYGMLLAEHQQEALPLRIFVRPVREVFKVKEDIEFDVVLENVSKQHMRVKSLGYDTLYFLINNQSWGTSPLSGQKGGADEILRAGQKTVLRFKGENFQRAQELEVICFYRMSIGDVNPVGKAKIVIQE